MPTTTEDLSAPAIGREEPPAQLLPTRRGMVMIAVLTISAIAVTVAWVALLVRLGERLLAALF